MRDDFFDYVVESLIGYAQDAIEDERNNPSKFNQGRSLAFYEVLDTIKNRLIVEEYDLARCGLDVNLEHMFSQAKKK